MNKSYRIKTNVNPNRTNNIKLKLEQEVDQFEILSLKIDQENEYNDFNCNHGVLVGRVVANGGVGIPNAKISVFIPLREEDENKPDIVAVYPYKNPRDQDVNGKRYNLLPRVAIQNPETGEYSPTQPFGSFPTKEEFITNSTLLEVYEKYYKYTTVTNQSGDYMIFGAPVGIQTIHMSVDITDVGKYSMTPSTMVTNLGFSPNLFSNNTTRIKPSNDLDDLPNIETQEISVDIIPFCGDEETFDIGITRQDFRIRAELLGSFTVFGSTFTDGENSAYGTDFQGNRNINELYRMRDDADINASISSKRIGIVNERIYYYPLKFTDEQIENEDVDPSDLLILDKSEYSIFKRNGDFVFIIPCNRRRVITNESGEEEVIPSDSDSGAFTEFKGFITFEYENNQAPMNFSDDIGLNTALTPFRHRYKVPQSAHRNKSFTDDDDSADTKTWKLQHYTFGINNIYSVAKFHGMVFNDYSTPSGGGDENQTPDNGFSIKDRLNQLPRDLFWNTGVISIRENQDEIFELPSNGVNNNGQLDLFGATWLNFSLHFIQNAYLSDGSAFVDSWRSNTNFTKEYKKTFFYTDNQQELAAGILNTKWYARSDLHYTDFIKVPRKDILSILENINTKGFIDDDLTLIGDEYKNGSSPVPFDGGRIDGDPSKGVDNKSYFFRGLGEADCITYLSELGII